MSGFADHEPSLITSRTDCDELASQIMQAQGEENPQYEMNGGLAR